MLRRILLVGVAAGLGTLLSASDARAQSLIEMYRNARFRVQAEHILETYGTKAVPFAVERVPYATDSMRQQIEKYLPTERPEPQPPSLVISEWHLIPKLGRSWFENKFGSDGWSFIGNNAYMRLDTTFTREIRARLESEFGAPTQTVADLETAQDRPIGEYIQFEYWFVLNDTIALRVMDVNGPLERGVVVACEQKYKRFLPELREELDSRLMVGTRRSRYADYYYLPDQRMWFITGFDGRRFFLKRISKPNLRLGRPVLEKVLDS